MATDTVYITSSVAFGTAIAYLMYQSYSLTKKQQHLMLQNSLLTDKLMRLEHDVASLKEISSHLEHLENDELFVDTSEYIENSDPSLCSSDEEEINREK